MGEVRRGGVRESGVGEIIRRFLGEEDEEMGQRGGGGGGNFPEETRRMEGVGELRTGRGEMRGGVRGEQREGREGVGLGESSFCSGAEDVREESIFVEKEENNFFLGEEGKKKRKRKIKEKKSQKKVKKKKKKEKEKKKIGKAKGKMTPNNTNTSTERTK